LVSTDDTLLPTSFAVLFADVSGSTRLYDTVGDTLAMTAIGQCLEIFRDRTEATGGRVIKTIGDEVMSAFPTADAAARTALQIQLHVDALDPVSGNKLGVRIGFHFGPAVERGVTEAKGRLEVGMPGVGRDHQSKFSFRQSQHALSVPS